MTTGTLSRSTRRRWGWSLWALMSLAAIGIALFAVPPYLGGEPANSKVPLDPNVALHFATLAVHAVPGGLVLALGPYQFVARLRRRWPQVHRVLGRVYMVSVVVAAVVSLVAAAYSQNGLAAQVGFVLLAVMWLYTLAKAYRTIRRGEVALHRIWMIRNYALTFAAVALRIYLLTGVLVKQSVPALRFDQIYTASVWASILVNVVVAEYFIVQRSLAPLARTRRREVVPAAASDTVAADVMAPERAALRVPAPR